MEKNIKISMAGLKRMPKYLRILKEKQLNNIQNISSTLIAEELKLNPIQVRKDLALVSKTDGKPGVGFEINQLVNDIEKFLGVNDSRNAIILGAGRLGQALLNYNGFENDLNIMMAFDNNKSKCDDIKIFHIDALEKKIIEKDIHIAIITMPADNAQEMCDRLVNSGIKAIWNFAPTNLKVPENIAIKNEDLSTSLLILLKMLEEKI
jgi:redox-sensing transcriptional repressor